MRSIFILLVVLIVPVVIVGTATAGCGKDCKCPTCTARDKAVTNFIYDVTIPWPFRHHAVVADADGDGVLDAMDKCPGTPMGAVVDEAGCPKDSDGDGVYDGIDKCPDTPKGVQVDAKGCPINKVEKALIDTGMFRTTEIVFDFDKAVIKPESHGILGEIGAALVAHPELEIEIGGYTDSVGTDEYNQTLSEERAKAVLDYLVKYFPKIERGQFVTKGYGEGRPITSNETAQGMAENRRVEFKVLRK